jgi:membrane peptidoglycan carboxypeptidase
VAGRLAECAPAGDARRGAGGERVGAARILRVAAAFQAPQGAGPAHPHPARAGRLHAHPRRTELISVRHARARSTAIGSRPIADALAELLGIVQSGGLHLASGRVEELRFAQGTPFETVLRPRTFVPERVLHRAVARAVRTALVDVVENGTAVRARGAFALPDGSRLLVGGKTGTGDNRIERFGPGLELTGSQVTSRSATFAFLIGNRHFGVITAYVAGAQAADFGFTSSLPVQVLRQLAPALAELVRPEAQTATAPPTDLRVLAGERLGDEVHGPRPDRADPGRITVSGFQEETCASASTSRQTARPRSVACSRASSARRRRASRPRGQDRSSTTTR